MPPQPSSGQARSLPPRPILEHLRKQAKDVLAAHKAGDAAAWRWDEQAQTLRPAFS